MPAVQWVPVSGGGILFGWELLRRGRLAGRISRCDGSWIAWSAEPPRWHVPFNGSLSEVARHLVEVTR